MEQNELLYYTAGIIDGEGYLGIMKIKNKNSKTDGYYYVSAVKVASVDKIMCQMLQDQFGGYLSKRIHTQPNQRLSYMWEIKNDKQVFNFLKFIGDKLIIKSSQAKVLKEFIEFRTKMKNNRFSGYKPEHREFLDKLYSKIRDLNYRGVRPAETK